MGKFRHIQGATKHQVIYVAFDKCLNAGGEIGEMVLMH